MNDLAAAIFQKSFRYRKPPRTIAFLIQASPVVRTAAVNVVARPGKRIVPIVHGTTYTALRDVSPMLASRSGLDIMEDTMAVVATKIAELVAIWS